jgi:hypothetical protein
MATKAKPWTVKRIRTLWASPCGGGFNFVYEGRFIVAKKQHADDALKREGVENPSSWNRFDVPGTNIVVFIACPFDHEAMSWRPDFLAKQRTYQEELNRVLDGTAPKPTRGRKGGRS